MNNGAWENRRFIAMKEGESAGNMLPPYPEALGGYCDIGDGLMKDGCRSHDRTFMHVLMQANLVPGLSSEQHQKASLDIALSQLHESLKSKCIMLTWLL